jgi:hypothetical protein
VYAFDAVKPAAGEEFRLTIKKTAGSAENNLRFVTYKMGQYDAYPNGSCLLDGKELAQDMLLSASFVSETPYTTIKRYTVFAIGIILLYTVTTIIFWTEEKRCRRFR